MNRRDMTGQGRSLQKSGSSVPLEAIHLGVGRWEQMGASHLEMEPKISLCGVCLVNFTFFFIVVKYT